MTRSSSVRHPAARPGVMSRCVDFPLEPVGPRTSAAAAADPGASEVGLVVDPVGPVGERGVAATLDGERPSRPGRPAKQASPAAVLIELCRIERVVDAAGLLSLLNAPVEPADCADSPLLTADWPVSNEPAPGLRVGADGLAVMAQVPG